MLGILLFALNSQKVVQNQVVRMYFFLKITPNKTGHENYNQLMK